MLKNVAIASLCLAALGATASAAAEPGTYLSGRLGVAYESFGDAEMWGSTSGPATHQYDRRDSGATFAAGAAVGYAFEMPLRAELEYTYRTQFHHEKNPTNNGSHDVNVDTQTQTLMVNGYYDFHNGTGCTPFLSAGIGWARHTTDAPAYPATGGMPLYRSVEQTVDRFAWSLGAGLAFDLTEAMTLDVQYRHLDLGRGEWQNHAASTGDTGYFRADLTSNEVLFGLRYAF